jgi:hypothetical protein
MTNHKTFFSLVETLLGRQAQMRLVRHSDGVYRSTSEKVCGYEGAGVCGTCNGISSRCPRNNYPTNGWHV